MSSLLPLLISPQNSSNASGGSGIATEASANVNKDQAPSFQQTVPLAFAQILREQHGTLLLQGNVEPLTPRDVKTNDVPLPFLPQKELENLEVVNGSDLIEQVLRESQGYRPQTPDSPELATQPQKSTDVVSDPSRFLPIKTYDGTIADDQKNIIQQSSLHRTVSTISHTPLDITQVLANALVQRQAFQSTTGEPGAGVVSQTRATNPLVPESVGVVPQSSLLKIAEVGPPSPHGAQSPEVKLATFLPNQDGEQGARTLAPFGKDAPVALSQANRVIQQTEPLKFSNHLSQTNSPIDLHHLRQNGIPLAPPVSPVPPAGPAGFAQTDSISQLVVKPIAGSASIVNDLSSSVIENRTTLQVDPLGDTGLLNKGDRSQTVIDASTKIVGLDASGGQGLGSGMNYPQNSQAGFQQPSTAPGQGMGVRGLEERVAEFPAPALQRLQMDVQLSETQRVSIDVGVQNRQVYAGLVTDHAVLRNLATQFVPQLENQLADVDMELQEFSAEVREERQQQDDVEFGNTRHTDQGSERSSQHELPLSKNSLNRQGEPGLHLVA